MEELSWDDKTVGTMVVGSKEEWDLGEYDEMSSSKIDLGWSMESFE